MKPLSGIKVLDFSRLLSGPICSMYLADMGAEVYKIERPGQGDDTRGYGPPFIGQESAYFLSVNRGKKSLTINMKHPEGKEVVSRLARSCDILLENFRPGAVKRLGFGYEELVEENPRLIYASISGFGHQGLESFRKKPGFDVVIQGMSGIPSLTGDPDGPPSKVGTSIADIMAGIYALIGILAALFAREKSGRGQIVDISMLDGMVSLLTYQSGIYFATGNDPKRMGNKHPTIAPYETFAAQDGYFNLGVGSEQIWPKFCTTIKREDLLEDPRFMSNTERVKNMFALSDLLAPIFKTRTVEDWLDTLSTAGIPCGPIYTVGEALNCPQLAARQMVTELNHPTAGKIKVVGNPVKLSDTPSEPHIPPPLLGQHNDSVLQEELGYTAEEVARLKDIGAIGCA